MFTGHIPGAMKRLFPTAQINHTSIWAEFSEEKYRGWYVEATDPLFKKMGIRFTQMLIEEFGTDHIFNGDQYLELLPPTDDPVYLAEASKIVYSALKTVDPKAIWMIQAWIFYEKSDFWKPPQVKAYLGAIPDDSMLILDLFADFYPTWNLFEEFYGKPWIYCILHNFGGNPGIYGNLSVVLNGPHKARLAAKHYSGIGIVMEATMQNYIIYEATSEARWRSTAPNPQSWVAEYVKRRYGDITSTVPEISDSWELVRTTQYNINRLEIAPLEWRPSLQTGNPKRVPNGLIKSWDLLLESNVTNALGNIATFQNDIVDLTREVLSELFTSLSFDITLAYESKNLSLVQTIGKTMIELINDLDALMGTNPYNLLGKWISDARDNAPTSEFQNFFEMNARLQVSTWGPRAPMGLNDYARKSWNGLYKTFYLPRWSFFVDSISESLESGKPYNQTDFAILCGKNELKWTQDYSTTFPSVPTGSPIEVSKTIHKKYRSLLN